MSRSNQEFVRYSMLFRQVCYHPDHFTVSGTLRETLSFLAGLYIGFYRVPEDELMVDPHPDDPMEGFAQWLAKRDGSEEGASWARTAYMILKMYDDDEAFIRLRQLFDQYISEQLGITAESYQNKLF
jgi:hypothetical protein